MTATARVQIDFTDSCIECWRQGSTGQRINRIDRNRLRIQVNILMHHKGFESTLDIRIKYLVYIICLPRLDTVNNS
jgi:hypothetical protein